MGGKESFFGSVKRKLSTKSGESHSPMSPSNSSSRDLDAHPQQQAPATRRPNRPGYNAFTTPSNAPPPSYHDAVRMPEHTTEDPYADLKNYDTLFLVDDSGSMAGRSWRECSEALRAIAPICTAHDADGIDLRFLNTPQQPHFSNITESSTVHEIFQTVRPHSSTPTGDVLRGILEEYLERYRLDRKIKRMNVIVITDGEPSDDLEGTLRDVGEELVSLRMRSDQLGVQFLQVGNEPGAKEYLQYLDDNLVKENRGKPYKDFVDTEPWNPAGLTAERILKVILGAVHRRRDNMASA